MQVSAGQPSSNRQQENSYVLAFKRALCMCMKGIKLYENSPTLPRLCSWFSRDFWLADTKGLVCTGLLLPTGAGVGRWAEAVCTACSMVGLLLKWSIWGLELPGEKNKTKPNPTGLFLIFKGELLELLVSTNLDWQVYLPCQSRQLCQKKKKKVI